MPTPASYHLQILNGMVGVVRGLNLVLPDATILPAAQVYTQALPYVAPPPDTTRPLPCVQITAAPLPETLDSVMNNTDNIGYPCGVAIITAKNQDLVIDDADLYWRQRIMGEFHERIPTTVPMPALVGNAALVRCLWEPGAVINPEWFKGANVWMSWMVFRMIVRKTRP